MRDVVRPRYSDNVVDRLHSLIREAVTPVCMRHEDVRRLYLFGSMARGDFDQHSDVDLWVLVDDTVRDKDHGLLRIYEALEDALAPCKVDVVSVTDPAALWCIWDGLQKDKVLLYERKANG